MFGTFVGSGEEGVLASECEGADRALDDIGVELDAAIVEEEAEPGPAGEHIADRFRQLALLADEGELLAQPWLEGVGDGTAAGRLPLLGRAAADLALNLVERRDANECLGRDRRWASLRQLVEAAAHVRPAEGEAHLAAIRQHLVCAIAIDLQHAPEAGEVCDGPLRLLATLNPAHLQM